MRRVNRLTQRQCESAMPTEEIVPHSTERLVQRYRAEQVLAQHFPDHLAAEMLPAAPAQKTPTGAISVFRNGKPVLVKRRTKYLCDGAGLYLVVSPGDDPDVVNRSWTFRYNVPGQVVVSKNNKARRLQRVIGLGSLQTVNLSRARELAEQCRRQLQEGLDPLLAKRGRAATAKIEERRLRTLQAAIDEYVRDRGKSWSVRHSKVWKQSLASHLKPLLDLPVSQIDRAMIIRALRPLWDKHPETGRRVRERLESVLDKATSDGWRTGDNPARWKGNLEYTFARRPDAPKKHPALPYKDAPEFMRQLRGIEGDRARALELIILTGVRTKELVTAMGDQFDLDCDNPVWTVPPEKTKTGKRTNEPHVIPLSDAAVACLRKLQVVLGKRVFEVPERAVYKFLREMRQDVTVHGFRATFRTWASEQTDYPHEVAEAALDHHVGKEVVRSYVRTTWIDKRRMLLRDWADFLEGKTVETGNIVKLRQGAK
jgi:integrase